MRIKKNILFLLSILLFPCLQAQPGNGFTSYLLSEISNDSLSVCSSEKIRLMAADPADSSVRYLWSTGDTLSYIDIVYKGETQLFFWCIQEARTETSPIEERSDSAYIRFLPPYAYLGPDTALCRIEDPLPPSSDTILSFDLSSQNQDYRTEYLWFDQDGEQLGQDSVFFCTMSMLQMETENSYRGLISVLARFSQPESNACEAYDTIEIRAIRSPHPFDSNLFIPYDTTLCADADLLLQIPDEFHGFWLDADSIVLPFGSDTNRYTIIGKRGTDGFGKGTDTRNPDRYYLYYRHHYCPWNGIDTIDVYNIVRPYIEIPSDTIICRDEAITIEADIPLAYEDFYRLAWNDGSSETEREFSDGGVFSVTYGLKDEVNECGFSQASDTISITWVDPAMTDLLIPTDTIICVDLTLTLDASVPFDSTRYIWEKGPIPELEFDEDSIVYTGPVIVIEEEGTYNITLIDSMGCRNQSEINVTIDECKPLLDIPNVFTPNGDGVNDELSFRQLEKCTDVEIQIVNRWGRTVLRSSVKNAEDFKWNGCLQNGSRKLPDGPYFYMVSYKNMYGKRKVQSGSITILGSTE